MTHSWDPSDALPEDLSGVFDWPFADGDMPVYDEGTGLFIPGIAGVAVEVVFHGADADYARPVVDGAVLWIGTVDPNNAEPGDFVLRTDLDGGDLSPLTTKGDVYTYSTDNDRLPVGTDGQFLSADSGETTGLLWVDAPSVDVENAGRWEVVVSGVPAEAVTNEADDDWLYTWTEV